MLEKKSIIDKIEVNEQSQIHVRRVNIITEDGVEAGRSYHRYVLSPGDDLTGQDQRVVAIASTIWTPAIIASYKESVAR